MGAAINGHIDVVQILLDAGADVNAKDNNGWTVLVWAQETGRTEVVEILKNAGATE